MKLLAFFLATLLLFSSCSPPAKPLLKVIATSTPHAEILEFVQLELARQGIELEILVVDDFNSLNRAVAEGEADANFFQHAPFLEAQKSDFGYRLESLTAVHLEPMGLYSNTIGSLAELKPKALIALPSDPSNLARALALLEQQGLISLNWRGAGTHLLDITGNPRQLQFIEMDAPLLARALDDVDAAAITANFALLGGLSPKGDAIALEKGTSSFANLIVIREGESQREDLQILKSTLSTERVRQFIETQYRGAVIPIPQPKFGERGVEP